MAQPAVSMTEPLRTEGDDLFPVEVPAGQAAAVCHMGAHALGAAAYAVKAASLGNPDRPEAAEDEIRWQLDHMSTTVRAVLRALPPVGENASGPLGPGLLASGQLARVIRAVQAGLTKADLGRPEE